jgi:hypothetical protein
MILVLCSAGHVAVAAREAAESIHEPAVLGDPVVLRDPFKQARGCRAIVYAPAPRLLDAAAGEIAVTGGIREVVRAAHAPGIERVVVIASPASFGKEDERVLEEDGVPFAIVRCAALLDELADATNLHTARSVWLPRGRVVELATRCALMATIRSALLRDDLSGSTIAVPALQLDIVEAMRRAAAIAGAAVKVHGTVPGLSSAMRRIHAWTHRRASLDVEVLCDRLSSFGSRSRQGRPGAAAAQG